MNEESNLYAKSQICKAHGLTLELQKCRIRATSSGGSRALIVEPEKDIQKVYRAYLAFRGVNAVIVDDMEKCLDQIFSPSYEGFEVVIIDTHLQNTNISSAIELAKTIKDAIPDQKIIVTTTSPLTEVSSKMMSFGISKEDLLVKPFELSRLLCLIQTQARMQ